MTNAHALMEAAPDILAMRMGLQLSHPHPLARGCMPTLKELQQAGIVVSGKASMSASGAVYGNIEISKALSEAAQKLIVRAFIAQSQHEAFAPDVFVKNFQPANIPTLDADVELELLGQNAEITKNVAVMSSGAEGAQLTTFAKIIGITRRDIYNDTLDAFQRMTANIGASAARLESRLIGEALESNQVLDDGFPVFDLIGDAHGNVVLDATIDTSGNWASSGIARAMTKLRTQVTASGNRADLAAKHLIVSPELEFVARSFLGQFKIDEIQIHVLSNLPPSRWYLLADPVIAPVVGRLKLAGTTSQIQVTPQSKNHVDFDGVAVRVTANLGATMTGRIGIVRGGN